MKEMGFIPKLTKFLKSNKAIYTVRGYRMVEKDILVEGIGVCHRLPMGSVVYSQLENYVHNSGFESIGAWVAKINQFIPKGKLWYLYKVEVKD